MGAGTSDEIVLVASQQILTTGTDTVSVSGVENLTYAGHSTDSDINVSFFNNQTFSLKDSSAIANTFTLDVNASDTAIDLSGMTVTTANKTAVNGDTFVVNASTAGDDGITSIKGSLVTKNTITANDLDATTIVGGALADALNGGALADTITGGEGADVIVGNGGADVIDLAETTSAVDKVTLIATNGKDTIKNFNTAKDVINLEGGQTSTDTAGAATVANVNVALTSGASTYNIASATATTDHITIIGTALSANGDLDVGTDGTELLKALSSTSTAAASITVDSAAKSYIAAFQDGNAYIFDVDAGSGNAVIVASEMELVVVLESVAIGSLASADFLIV
jgi:hypothetical protein